MESHISTKSLRERLLGQRNAGRSIALVPTMGNLHEGHLALVEAAQRDHDIVVASIFVNPLQFSAGEDYDNYPRTLEADHDALRDAGVAHLFTPDVNQMYPNGQDDQTQIILPSLAEKLCGEHRPGHFDGVGTIVLKLLNIVQPNSAFFGEKDYQQLMLIRAIARDLSVPSDIIGVPTVRAADGLALSSRNQYLDKQQRAAAPVLHQTLADIAHALDAGARNFDALLQTGRLALKNAGFKVDYLEIRDAHTLDLPDENTSELRVLGAAWLGFARLIDNLGTGR